MDDMLLKYSMTFQIHQKVNKNKQQQSSMAW